MTGPNRFDDLPPSAQLRIDEICDRFEADWLGGARPRLEDYLAAATDTESPALGSALVALDVEYRQKHGESPTPSEYAARVPALPPGELARLLSPAPPPDRGDTPNATGQYTPSVNDSSHSPGRPSGTVQPVPGYEVFEELGRGGMGVVYHARQVALNRSVALKMVLGGDRTGRIGLVRFLAEAEAMAAVRHPNVVQVYDYGEHDGRPYMALEYLPGGTLAGRLRDVRTPREAARVVASVARGVAAAHDLGIVHRDLKPANVLLDERGEPKVTDFGLAKRSLASDVTRTGVVLGTPAYMAPEQAQGESKYVGPQADVWALGVILYEALTGRRPFEADSSHAVLRRVIDDDPPPPSRVAPGVPRDLEAVCLKCLEKALSRRYPTAAEVAAELDRFAAGEPVSARPAGRAERAAKWAKRRPYQAATLAFAVLAVGLGGGGSVLWALWRESAAGWAVAEGERDKAEGARRIAEDARGKEAAARADLDRAYKEIARRDYLGRANLAGRAFADGDIEVAGRLLDECGPEYRGEWEWKFLDRAVRPLVVTLTSGAPGAMPGSGGGGFARSPFAGDDPAQLYALSPDGRHLACSSPRTAAVFDARSGKQLAAVHEWKSLLFPPPGAEARFAFAPDGRELFLWRRGVPRDPTGLPVGSRMQVPGRGPDPAFAELNRLSGEITVLTLRPDGPPTPAKPIRFPPAAGQRSGPVGVAAHPDGKHLLVASWVAPKAETAPPTTVAIATVSRDDGSMVGTRRELPFPRCDAVVFAPTGDRAAFLCGSSVPGAGAALRVVDLKSGLELLRITSGQDGYARSESAAVSFDPTGTRLAVVWRAVNYDGSRGTARPTVWDAVTGAKLATLGRAPVMGHTESGVTALAFAADGRLVTGGDDGWLQVWDVETGAAVRSLRGHTKPVAALAVGGATVASVGGDGVTRVWNLAAAPAFQPASAPRERYQAVRVEGPLVAVGGADARIIRPGAADVRLEKLGGSAFPRAFSRDRTRLLGVEHRQEKPSRTDYFRATLWDAATGRATRTFDGPGIVAGQALSPDGSLVVVTSAAGPMKVIDAATGAVRHTLELPADEKTAEYVARGTLNAEVSRVRQPNLAHSAGFSPDGRFLATFHLDRTYRFWNPATGQLLGRAAPRLYEDIIPGIEFDPHGRLVTADADGRVRLWNPATGAEVPTPLGAIPGKWAGSFNRDSTRWVRTGPDGTDRLYDVASGTELFNFAAVGLKDCRFTPGGELIGFAGLDQVQFDDARPDDRFAAPSLAPRPGPSVAGVAVSVPVENPSILSHFGTITAATAATVDGKPYWFVRGKNGEVGASYGSGAQWTATVGPGHTLAADAGGQTLAAGGADGSVTLLDVRTGKVVRKLEGPAGKIEALAVGPGGGQVAAVVSSDKGSNVRVWLAVVGRPDLPARVMTLDGPTADVKAVTISNYHPNPDPKQPLVTYLATAHADGAVRLWDANTRKELFVLRRHDGPVTAATFTADGTRLVTTGADKTVRLWDLKSRKAEMARLPHPARAVAIDAAYDGRLRVAILAGDGDGPAEWLWVWDRSGEQPEPLARVTGGRAAGAVMAVVPPPSSGNFGGSFPGPKVLTADPGGGVRLWSLPAWTYKPPTAANPATAPKKP